MDWLITPPILVIEGADLQGYRTQQAAERALEPVDVRQGVFQIYDSTGLVLDAQVDRRDRTVIRPSAPVRRDPERVLDAIRQHFRHVPPRRAGDPAPNPSDWTLGDAVRWLESVSSA